MAADLLDYSQRDTCVAHLGESCSPKTVGRSSLNADALASFPEKPRSRVAGNVPPMMSAVAAWK